MKEYPLTQFIIQATTIDDVVLHYCPSCGWNAGHSNPINNSMTHHAMRRLITFTNKYADITIHNVMILTLVKHIVDVIPMDNVLLSMVCTTNLITKDDLSPYIKN